MKQFNKTIQMLIFNGNPNGRIMCELSNWNGRIYKIARNNLADFEERNDSQNTGVYFLFGKTNDGEQTVYIGEAEKIYARLKQHLKDEIYWNDCIVVVSKDNLLNKAHVKFLENKFYNLATKSNRYKIINNTIPTCSSIAEFDLAMLEEFINNTKLLVNLLGYKVFDSIEENIKSIPNENNYFYINTSRGASGKGLIVSDGFAVFKGSTIANSVAPSTFESIVKLREKLISEGIINSNFCFVKDYIFTSPSLAASIIMGRMANGRTEWKTKDNKTLKQIEECK